MCAVLSVLGSDCLPPEDRSCSCRQVSSDFACHGSSCDGNGACASSSEKCGRVSKAYANVQSRSWGINQHTSVSADAIYPRLTYPYTIACASPHFTIDPCFPCSPTSGVQPRALRSTRDREKLFSIRETNEITENTETRLLCSSTTTMK